MNFFPVATWLLNFLKSWSLAKIGHTKSGHIQCKKVLESEITTAFSALSFGNNFNREI